MADSRIVPPAAELLWEGSNVDTGEVITVPGLSRYTLLLARIKTSATNSFLGVMLRDPSSGTWTMSMMSAYTDGIEWYAVSGTSSGDVLTINRNSFVRSKAVTTTTHSVEFTAIWGIL